MASFNKVILAGNLTRDPELRYTPKGTAIAKLSMAVNRRWTGEDGQTRDEVILVFRQTLDMGDVRDLYEELVLLLTRKLLQQVAGEGAAIRVTLPHRGCCPQELYMSQFGVLP